MAARIRQADRSPGSPRPGTSLDHCTNLRFSVFIATSLDGFIEADGDLDWLLSATTSTDDHGYAAYMQSVDTLLLGRNTYEKVLSFDPWPYAGKRVVVMSNTLAADAVPPALADDVRLLHGTVREPPRHWPRQVRPVSMSTAAS